MKIKKKQKVFLSFAFTDHDPDIVVARMRKIVDVLAARDITAYCNEFDKRVKDFTQPGQYIKSALPEIAKNDVYLAIVTSDHRSIGQLMEFGVAKYLQKPVFLLQHSSAVGTTYLDDKLLSDSVHVWSTDDELLQIVQSLVE